MFRYVMSALLVTALLFATSAAMAAHGEGGKASPFAAVTAQEVKALLTGKNKAHIIDVRSIKEYKYSHIPGAVNVPSPAVRMLKDRLPKDKSALIIVYERGDSILATQRAFKQLGELGYTNVRHFQGGILGWLNLHYPVNKGGKP